MEFAEAINDALLAMETFPNETDPETVMAPVVRAELLSVPAVTEIDPPTWEMLVELNVPPLITNASLVARLLTVEVPELNVIVGVPVRSGMTTSSEAPGSTPPTQLLGVLQLPPV